MGMRRDLKFNGCFNRDRIDRPRRDTKQTDLTDRLNRQIKHTNPTGRSNRQTQQAD